MDASERIPILAISDGRSIQLFGDRKRLTFHVVESPTVQGIEAELWAERLVDEQLPWRYRELYYPGCLLATIVPRVLRPSDLVAAHADVELLRAIKRLADDCRAEQQETVL